MDQYGEELRKPEKLNAISTLWAKIYSTDLIKNIEFQSLEKLGLCEDGYFNISAFEKASRVVFQKKYLYHYRKVVSGNSLTQRKKTDIFANELKLYHTLMSYIEAHHLDNFYEESIQNRLAISLIESGITIINSRDNIYFNVKNILHDAEYEKACKKLDIKFLPLHWKIFFLFAKLKHTFGVIFLLKIIVKLSSRK